jgi:hypothetical protein
MYIIIVQRMQKKKTHMRCTSRRHVAEQYVKKRALAIDWSPMGLAGLEVSMTEVGKPGAQRRLTLHAPTEEALRERKDRLLQFLKNNKLTQMSTEVLKADVANFNVGAICPVCVKECSRGSFFLEENKASPDSKCSFCRMNLSSNGGGARCAGPGCDTDMCTTCILARGEQYVSIQGTQIAAFKLDDIPF